MDLDRWLTAKRLRAHGLLLGLTLWSLYFWTIATPGLRDRNGNLKGTDFLHFYTLGTLATKHNGADLYDINAQAAIAADRVPQAAGIRYLPLYPPQVSLLFAPFAHFSYGRALILWWMANVSIYSACCFAIWKICPNLQGNGGLVFIAAAAFPPFFHLIAWGQTSALGLACFTVFFLMLRRRWKFLAGLILGCLIFKPQLGLAAAIIFLTLGEWKIVGGAALSAVAELSLGVVRYGLQPLRTWLHTVGNVGEVSALLEPRPYQTHCLRTFWSMLIPWETLSVGLYLISAVIILAWTTLVWKRSFEWPPRMCALLLATVLVSPHLTVYDLVILAPGILLLSDWLIARPPTPARDAMGTLLYLVYVLPLVGPFTRWTHFQLSVVAMGMLSYAIARSVKQNKLAEGRIEHP